MQPANHVGCQVRKSYGQVIFAGNYLEVPMSGKYIGNEAFRGGHISVATGFSEVIIIIIIIIINTSQY